ncbi:MAG: helix-turn-helix transcriptional regulator [Lachnospiraceae bacterium]|nr:helix-turn-helix transcriptional regulator [Lachnospiraceae bacterium]
METPYRPIPIHQSIHVESIRSVYRYEQYRISEPYEENYPFWQINFQIRGKGFYEVNGETYPLNDGDVLFRRAGRTSKIIREFGSTANIAIISFSSDSEALDALPASPVRLYGEERATLLDLIRTGTRICTNVPISDDLEGFELKPGVPEVVLEFVGLSLERFLVMVLCRLQGHPFLTNESEKSNRHNSRSTLANELRAALETRIFGAVRLEDLAKEFGISTSGLMKLYKREFGVPIMQDFIRMKLGFAKRQIGRGDQNFTEIAEQLGFSSAGYFSRIFRTYEGITPTEYSRLVSKKF